MSRNRRVAPHAKRAGFTLVELMIAMSAGLLAVIGAYYLGNSSARAFSELMRTTETQTAMRAALEQLGRDIPRAGFLSTSDSTLLANCDGSRPPSAGTANGALYTGATQLFGVRIDQDANANTALNVNGNVTRADVLTLLGNYETGEIYKLDAPATNLNGNSPSQLIFDTTRESFRRSFVIPAVGTTGTETFDQARFNSVFAVNRLVRIESSWRVFFRVITAAASASNSGTITASITLDAPIESSCFKSATALVTPVSMIRYQVGGLGAQFSRLNYQTNQPGNNRLALIRSDIDPTQPANILGSSRLVLDYAVEFQVDGIANTTPGTSPPTWGLVTSAGGANNIYSNAVWPNLRSLRVTLSARTEEAEANFAKLTRTGGLDTPLLGYAVNVGTTAKPQIWYSRVRTLRMEFGLPNINSAQ